MNQAAPFFAQGDRVLIVIRAASARGVVTLASNNGRSLMLEFEAILSGHVGMMPVLQEDDGGFRSIITREVVQLTRIEAP